MTAAPSDADARPQGAVGSSACPRTGSWAAEPAAAPWATAAVDPADPAFTADPFPFYAGLRAQGPAVPVALANGRTAWIVTSHEHARAALADRRLSAAMPAGSRPADRAALEDHMLNADGPRHARLRRLVSAAFSPTAVAALRPRIEQLADDLLDDLSRSGGCVDLVDVFAFPLPVLVMCEVLGVPPADRDALRAWTYALSAPKAATSAEQVAAAWTGLHDYFVDLVGATRRHPGEALFSTLVHAHDADGALSDGELLGMAFLLLFAGYETTMNLLAGGALALMSDPALRGLLASGQLSWPSCVEELLRLVSPLEGATWRFAAQDVQLGSATIPAGASVLVSLAGANHDPGAYPDPSAFTPDRPGPRHLAFGHGPHTCLGARLARLEAEIGLSRLVARFPHLRVAASAEEIPWRPGLLVRGPRRLPVRLDDPLEHLRADLEARDRAGLRRRLVPRAPSADVLDLAGNDYLGLARDARVVEAAAQAARTWGGGATGSRLVTGTTELHEELEAALAAHAGAPAGLVFSSGYLANLGVVMSLARAGDLVVSDAQNHASLIDACRLSRARVAVAPHRDLSTVESLLAQRSQARAVVVTDAVFSVDGQAAPLPALASACRRQGALLVADEAHSLGVVGDAGRGAVWAAGLAGAPDVIRTVTLSKALGSQGGAVLADAAVIEHLISASRPFIFDTALAPAAAGSALAALRILSEEPERAGLARAAAERVAGVAVGLGLPVSTPAAAVVSIRIGDPHLAVAAAAACLTRGVRVGCFRPPSVPDAESRLRLTARADLTEGDHERIATALSALADLIAGHAAPGPVG